MIYELHVTVDHTKRNFSMRLWEEVCRGLLAKPLDIRLDAFQAKHDRQVMFAAVHEGQDDTAAAWQAKLLGAVVANGFSPLRIKLEVPLDKSARYENPYYHECHVKALIPADMSGVLVDNAHKQGWLASWNELFPNDAGLEKWYFTLRSGKPYKEAQRDFVAAYEHMVLDNFHTVRMESETVIYDSNHSLDEGWA